jgi:hypothetical protein
MKNVHRWPKAILCPAMLMLLVACATPYVPAPDLMKKMSVTQARKAVINKLMRKNICTSGSCGMAAGLKPITGVRVTPTRLVIADAGGSKRVFQLNAIKLSIIKGRGDGLATGIDNIQITNTDATDELYVLQQNAINAPKAADEYDASFTASLADYHKKAASNTVLPEEVNKYKVQAESAVRDKAFDDAADLYAAALKIAPWWPVGHFNRALVLGETGDYGDAKREMKYYLQLVPDAPNARAAQDKIYEWERLESK